MRFKTLIILTCFVLVLSFFSGVSAQDAPLVGVSVVGTEHNWDIYCYNGVIDTLEEAGINVRGFDGERRADKMVADLETIYELQPDAVIVILGQHDALQTPLNQIHDAGIPIVTVDLMTEQATTNVSSNNYGMGIDIALEIVDHLEGDGDVGVFYRPGAWVAEIRKEMLDIVLADFPNIQIIAEQPYQIPGTVPHAYETTQDMLRANPSIKAFWSVFDMPMIGAAQAIEDMGLQDEVKVFGIDGDPQAAAMLRGGNTAYKATAVQQPYEIGQTAANIAIKIINGEDVPYVEYVDHFMATTENIEELIQELPKYQDMRN